MELADGLVVSGGAIIESGARFRRSPRKASFLPDSFGSPLPSELKFYARGGDSDSEDDANGTDGGKRARGAAASGGEGGDESPRTESDAEANAESGDEGADAAESDREIADMDKVKRSSARKIRAADSANGEAEDEDEEDREDTAQAADEPQLHHSQVTLFRAPLVTLHHLHHIVLHRGKQLVHQAILHPRIFSGVVAALVALAAAAHFDAQRPDAERVVFPALRLLAYVGFWVGAGVASSIGLGTGFHTFVILLSPHIVQSINAAKDCQTMRFDVPNMWAYHYPHKCLGPAEEGSVTLWSMYKSVALPAFLWGAGTAIGELPPYLFARAARLAGRRLAELREVDEEARSSGSLTLLERAKVWIYEGLQRYGMVVIVLCASVPNPAFDMAGITCGHFLVPVWSFFLATFLGKAVIKANLQTWFMILVFGSDLVDNLALWLNERVPVLGAALLKTLVAERHRHEKRAAGEAHEAEEGSLLKSAWNIFITGMVLYFLVALINALVQERLVELELAKSKHAEHDEEEEDEDDAEEGAASPRPTRRKRRAAEPETPRSEAESNGAEAASPLPRRRGGARRSLSASRVRRRR